MKISQLLPVMATMLALSGLLHAADSEADVLWKKMDDALTAIKTPPATQPKSREEAMEIYKQRLAAADEAGKAFIEKFPKDARRWKISMFEAMTAELRPRLGLPEKGEMKKLLAEIAAAPDADADIRGEASAVIVLQSASGLEEGAISVDEWKKLAENHLKAFPDFKFNANIKKQIEELPKIIEKIKAMADIKTKPLDLKFTAVDGREVDLSKMSGKVVLIDFWATWCGPCVAEVPNVVKTYEKLHEKGFEIIGISLDQDKGKLESFTKEKNMAWAQYFDGKGWGNEISTRFGIHGIPAMWLVNKKGMVVSTNARGTLEAEVEKLLAE